jgi:hypothetical protein
MSASPNTPEPRPSSFLDRAEQRGHPLPHQGRVCSSASEVGQVPASGGAVSATYRAEHLARLASAEFGSVEDALRWCGLDLSWVHLQHAPGRTMLVGSDSAGEARATVTGPLLALLPECCEVERI